jgi:hypothetical protein
MGEFLCNCESFAHEIEDFVQNVSEEVGNRLKKLINNEILQFATLLDPRFAYAEEFFTKMMWNIIEEEFINFVKGSKFEVLLK